MTTIGRMWLETISGKDHLPPQLPPPAEHDGELYFTEVKGRILPDAIKQAGETGGREIILDAPIQVVGTRAYEEFVSWARTQELDARFAGVVIYEQPTAPAGGQQQQGRECRAAIQVLLKA